MPSPDSPSALVALTPHKDGTIFRLRVKPKARADQLTGEHGGALKLSVRAAPEGGKANIAVGRLLAEKLRLPASSIEIVAGSASQDKTVLVRGLSVDELRQRLARVLD